MNYYIYRNSKAYGPFSSDVLAQYVTTGQVLKCDSAYEENNPNDIQTIGYFLKKEGRKTNVASAGSLIKQMQDIGKELIIPKDLFSKSHWKSDRKLLVLAIIGLTPLGLIPFVLGIGSTLVTFYAISLYFATIWGVFFYYLFKTPQVTLKRTLLVFIVTQVFIFLFFGVGLNQYVNPIYFLGHENGFFLNLIFYIFAVGVTEELSKQVPLYILEARTKEPIIPQTLVYYGLMSGIAFGVFEGVEYQLTVNMELDYGDSFFMNIARLTSLPFLHAVWAGIGAYFISFAHLYPKYRFSLYTLAVFVPAFLHGVYDGTGWIISLPITIISILLLMLYLKQGVNMQSKLRS